MDLLILSVIFFLGGFTQGLTGFGSALVAVPLAGLLIELDILVPLTALHGIVITSFLSWQLRENLSIVKLKPLVIGCIPGVMVGVLLLRHADRGLLKILLGLFVAGYSLYRLTSKHTIRTTAISSNWAYPAGFFTGIFGAAFSAGGPPAVIYTSLTDWRKDDIKATMSSLFLFTGLLSTSGHAFGGFFTWDILLLFAATVPFIFLGVWAGSRLYARIDQRLYLRVMLVGLLIAGLLLILSSFR